MADANVGMTDNLPPEHKRVDIVFPISGNTSVIENPAGDVGHSPNDVKEASNLRTETVEKGTDMSIKDRVLLIDSFLSDVPDNVTSGSHEIKTEATVSLTRGSEQSEEIKVAIKETADGVSKRKTGNRKIFFLLVLFSFSEIHDFSTLHRMVEICFHLNNKNLLSGHSY